MIHHLARRTVLVGLASAPLSLPLRAAAQPDRTALLAEIGQTRSEIDGFEAGSFDRYEEPEAVRAISCLWTLTERWTSEYLDAHPQASAHEIEADLAPVAKAGDLLPSVVRLTGDAVVISLERGFQGTVFVLSRIPSQPFAVSWDIQTQAAKSPLDVDLASWLDTVPGVHAGPLGGRVLALPPHRSGRPRFLIDAYEHAGMGLDVPGQISVWEWTGIDAVPELIQAYFTTGGAGAKLQGDRVRIRTKESTLRIYTCGSCDDPQGTWTLRVTPDRVVDLGHTFDDPLVKLVDTLLDRVIRRQDTSALASRAARAQLAKILESERHESPEGGDLLLGMRGLGTERSQALLRQAWASGCTNANGYE
jgi:hypothetical protein